MGGVGLFGNGGGGAARGLPELIERIRREHLRRENDLNRQQARGIRDQPS